MAGNVWEWVDDADGTRRLILGGSWYNPASARHRDLLDAA
jgi:formylglycine-generating enzyme required for sulfatase activity